MKKFGIDIDDTLVQIWNEQIFVNYNQKYDQNMSFDDIETFDFNSNKKLEKVFFDFFYNHQDLLELYPYSRDVLLRLSKSYEIYFITSRKKKQKEGTRQYLEKHLGKGFSEDIIFTCDYEEDKKCHIAKSLDCDIVIDDAPHHIENYVSNTDIDVIIIYDQPWNRHIKADSKRTFRVFNWKEVENIML